MKIYKSKRKIGSAVITSLRIIEFSAAKRKKRKRSKCM